MVLSGSATATVPTSTRALDDSSNRIRLAKLHGSIDWFQFTPDPSNPNRIEFGRAVDYRYTHDSQGNDQRPNIWTPEFLVGTFNKMLDYTRGKYADLFCLYRRWLWQSDALIVSGYGFADKGINRVISEWLRYAGQRRLVIVHRDPEDCRRRARGEIQSLLQMNQAQINWVDEWIEDARWTEIRAKAL